MGIPSKYMIRYADDFILLSDSEDGIGELTNLAINELKKINLEVSPEKTKVVDLREGTLEFLGFRLYAQYNGQAMLGRHETCKGTWTLRLRMTAKAKKKAHETIANAVTVLAKFPTMQNLRSLNGKIIGI